MIVYQLACGQGHFFEGWFGSVEACERQVADGLLECPTCSSPDITRLPSAPHVHTSRHASAGAKAERPTTMSVTNDAARQEVLLALRRFILEKTENVGRKFPEVARRIHYKEEDPRGIRGQVTPEEAEELSEEGVTTFAISPEVIPSEEVH
jgi:hypothetical protein